jgi:hypothetical protein
MPFFIFVPVRGSCALSLRVQSQACPDHGCPCASCFSSQLWSQRLQRASDSSQSSGRLKNKTDKPVNKRRQLAKGMACLACTRSKTGCDGNRPCARCVRVSGGVCFDKPRGGAKIHQQAPWMQPGSLAQAAQQKNTTSVDAPMVPTRPGGAVSTMEDLKAHMQQQQHEALARITNFNLMPATADISKCFATASQGMLPMGARELLGVYGGAGGGLSALPVMHQQFNPLLTSYAPQNLVIFAGQDLANKYSFASAPYAGRDKPEMLSPPLQIQTSSAPASITSAGMSAFQALSGVPNAADNKPATSIKGSDGLELLADVISKNDNYEIREPQALPLRPLRLVPQHHVSVHGSKSGDVDAATKHVPLEVGIHAALFAKV